MEPKIVNDVYKQYGLLGLIVLLLGAVIVYIIWDRVQDAKKEKEIEEKKKKGTYESWEFLSGRIKSLENESGHLFSQTKTIFEKIDKLEEKMDKKFDTLDSKIDSKFDILTKILLERK